MNNVEYFNFDYPNQYAHIYSEATRAALSRPGRGRRVIRFNVVKRDGKLTPVLFNLTLKQLREYEQMAESQGSKIW